METVQGTANDNMNNATDLINKCEKYSVDDKRVVLKMPP